MTVRRVGLNWGHNSHAAARKAKCRYCGVPTFLRDDGGKPSHKTCAEQAIEKGQKR